jgi:hypothetical protein
LQRSYLQSNSSKAGNGAGEDAFAEVTVSIMIGGEAARSSSCSLAEVSSAIFTGQEASTLRRRSNTQSLAPPEQQTQVDVVTARNGPGPARLGDNPAAHC